MIPTLTRYCYAKLTSPSLVSLFSRLGRCSSTLSRQWSTPLAKSIGEAIETTGPISIAAYMRQCLTNPEAGYYTTRSKVGDQFGEKGDFVTSPEISQVFGELVGLWIVAEWMSQGRQSKGVELVEFGPGRGTLMDDVLRTTRNFPSLARSIECVYLVEASPTLREQQKALLCGDAALDEIAIGVQSRSKYDGTPVAWCEDIRLVPRDASKTPFFIAHEFFDALPIHAFQSVAPDQQQKPSNIKGLDGKFIPIRDGSSSSKTNQWRELLVSPTSSQSSNIIQSRSSASPPKDSPDFQLSLAKASTRYSLVLPESRPRYKALKAQTDAVIEISPESKSYVSDIATRIGGWKVSPARSTYRSHSRSNGDGSKQTPSGAALIIDYGPESTIPTSTLRGIQSHRLVSPFISPGQVDLSADVDFLGLAEAAIDASERVEVHGPIEQGEWLKRMGVQERAEMLIKAAGDDTTKADTVRKAVQRLVERGGGAMGRLYKVMAIVPEAQGKRRPVGFGGELQ